MIRRLLWFEPIWLLCVVPFVLLPGRLLPSQWQPIIVAALLLFWPLRWLATHRLLPRAPLNAALVVMLLWLPVNIWAATDRPVAWQVAGYLLLGVALYVASLDWPPFRRRPGVLVWLLLVLAGGLALAGPFIAVPDSVWPLIGSLQARVAPYTARLGETINPNILAGALVVLMPLSVAVTVERRTVARGSQSGSDVWTRLIALMLAVLMTVVIALAASRGALLAAAAGFFVVLGLRWPRLFWIAPVLLLVAAGAVVWLGPATLLDQVSSGGAVGGLDQRMEIWSRALYALQDFSFSGVGLGGFNQVIPLLYPYFLIPPSVDIPHAHNLILQVGVDLGLPGLVAWLAILIAVAVRLVVLLRRGVAGIAWGIAAGVMGGLVAMLAHGLLDAALWGNKLAFIPWLLLALAMLAADSTDVVSGAEAGATPR